MLRVGKSIQLHITTISLIFGREVCFWVVGRGLERLAVDGFTDCGFMLSYFYTLLHPVTVLHVEPETYLDLLWSGSNS